MQGRARRWPKGRREVVCRDVREEVEEGGGTVGGMRSSGSLGVVRQPCRRGRSVGQQAGLEGGQGRTAQPHAPVRGLGLVLVAPHAVSWVQAETWWVGGRG